MSELEQAKQLINDYKLLCVSKTWCPDCVYAKKVMDELKAKPHYVELDLMDNGKELQAAFLELTKQNTVPNLFIAGEHIGTEHDIKRMHENGELEQKLKAAGLVDN